MPSATTWPAVYSCPLIADTGFLLGPLLVAWAAAGPAFEPARQAMHTSPQRGGELLAVVPYVPLVLATLFLSGKVLSGATLTVVEGTAAVSIFFLIAVREGASLASARFNQSANAEAARDSFGDAVQRAFVDRISVPAPDPPTIEDEPATDFDRRMRKHVLFLRDEHRRHLEQLQQSGNRVAWWTFVGGVLLGALGNVVVAVVMG